MKEEEKNFSGCKRLSIDAIEHPMFIISGKIAIQKRYGFLLKIEIDDKAYHFLIGFLHMK